MNTKLQFRVLYRQFLFRLMDVELLSASAGGDASAMFGQFVSLLIFGSLLSAYMSLPIGAAVRDSGLPGPVWWAERTVISVTMLVVGVFALLSWDSTFPDRRDVLVLGALRECGGDQGNPAPHASTLDVAHVKRPFGKSTDNLLGHQILHRHNAGDTQDVDCESIYV